MVKNNRKNALEIISIDPVSLQSYRYLNKEIKPVALNKVSKNSFYISYIQSKDVISTTVDISNSIPDNSLKDVIEIKAYDELGLDSGTQYSITYIELITNNAQNRTFNIFVIDQEILNTQLADVKSKTVYIDYVATAPFSIASLYQKALLEKNLVDCFVYFQQNDAFLAIYKNGEYLYSKSLHYSLNELTEKFCKLIGTRIDEKEFFRLLTTDDEQNINSTHKSFLSQLFSELFLYINDVIIFVKRSYEIESINRVYIGSEIGAFSSANDYAKNYLGLEPLEFNFNIATNSKESYVDQIHILMILTAQIYLEDNDEKLNFSVFKRPPPLKERLVGKLINIIIASVLLSSAYPFFQYAYTQYLNIEIAQASSRYEKANKEANIMRGKISELRKREAKIEKLGNDEYKKLSFRKKLLAQIYKKKTSSTMKSYTLVELIGISNKYGNTISLINFSDKNIKITVKNSNEKKITEFIEELTSLKKYKIRTKKIEKDEKTNIYYSEVRIGFKHG